MAVSVPVASATVASNTQLFSTGRIDTTLTRPSIEALRAAPSAAMAVTPLGETAGGAPMKPCGPVPAATGCSLIFCGTCLLYTSDAADDLLCVDLGGRRIIK